MFEAWARDNYKTFADLDRQLNLSEGDSKLAVDRHQSNESRKQLIPRAGIDRVLAEAPDAEWRVIVVMARYGGLRTPSETFALRWGDINWERGTICVACPKLAHHEQHASRIIPLFPERLKPKTRTTGCNRGCARAVRAIQC